jgi:2-succinyl-5-enolpyruvyl-6-hydroxy-3-cyclohexene-1-carboxylate synthase
MTPSQITLQNIFNCIEIATQNHITNWIVSPGSRVAPLTLAIVRNENNQVFTITDERSAAFVGLGQALQFLNDKKNKFVGLACTSGSAVYNYAPAIAEAFYQQIPLLVLTADRPPEWIGQQDGQTIQQRNIYQNHVKAFFELPSDFSNVDNQWHAMRIFNEACLALTSEPFAPVHINIPIKEPFYPQKEEKIFPQKINVWKESKPTLQLNTSQWQEIFEMWEDFDNKLIVIGQHFFDENLQNNLQKLYQDFKIPIVADSLSNCPCPDFIHHHDIFLEKANANLREKLRPELLITFGKSLISKSLKQFLREYKPAVHLHIQGVGAVADTFQSLTHIIRLSPQDFWKKLYEDLDFKTMLERDEEGEANQYTHLWLHQEHLAQRKLARFFAEHQLFSELEAIGLILEDLPQNSVLHVGNSMPIRYVNVWGIEHTDIQVFCNRGTSGIDGCVSTAVGAALAQPQKNVVLIVGDLSFLYDKNALWNNYLPNNLKIIVLNNFGGNIFGMIEGPKNQPELETYFYTPHAQTFKNTAQDFGLKYQVAHDKPTLTHILDDFFQDNSQPHLLEILTDREQNIKVWQEWKKFEI